jgi:DNA-binding MarR family transcriptional regulator
MTTPSNKPTDIHLAQLLELGLSPTAAQAAIDIDGVMTYIRRSMAKREMGRMALRDLELPIDVADLDILAALEGCSAHSGEATVGFIAERLNVDPSRASRIVADAVDKGVIRRVASQADARRIGLELTEAGHSYAQAIRRYKWKVFADALGQWPEDDLVTFARLFQRFSGRVAEEKSRVR